MNNEQMLRAYLEAEIEKYKRGENRNENHHIEYDVGVQYGFEWALQLLNEPETLKIYYDKAVAHDES